MTEKIGENKYTNGFNKTLLMLTLLDKQGSAARYSKQLVGFTDMLGLTTYKKSSCELEKRVTQTATMKGEIIFASLLSADNTQLMKIECIAWGIDIRDHSVVPPKKARSITWTQMRQKIIEIKVKEFYENTSNTGKNLPENFKKTFKQRSYVEFILKEK